MKIIDKDKQVGKKVCTDQADYITTSKPIGKLHGNLLNLLGKLIIYILIHLTVA